MRKLTTLLGVVLIAVSVAACDLLPFLPNAVDEPGESPGAASPTIPEAEFSVPPVDPERSIQPLPSPTIEIPPPID